MKAFIHNYSKLQPRGVGSWANFDRTVIFPIFQLANTLAIEYHVYIWQVSSQLSCGDTCQIWMWFKESSRYFCKIENFVYGEITERSFSKPHPWCRLELGFQTPVAQTETLLVLW